MTKLLFTGLFIRPKGLLFCLARIAGLALLLSGCAGVAQSAVGDIATRKIQAVATTGMIGDAVQNVGGDRVQVITLMGPGVDPHLFKASARDVESMAYADVIFYNGLHLEAGMATVLERIEGTRRVVAVTDQIDRARLVAPPQFKGAYDPHVWFDVSMWMSAVDQVRDTLSEMDPGSADLYRANAQAYLEVLRDLDDYVKQQCERIPADRRVLITAHDAFNYFGMAYGFDVRGLQGISTATEAGTGDVQALVTFIVERQIPSIFVESSVPQRNIEAVQAAVEARGFHVQIGGQLYSDAMGSPGTPEGTYIGMVRANIDTIVEGLLETPQVPQK